MAQQYRGRPEMMIDWGEDDCPPKLERWLLRKVFGYFRPYCGHRLCELVDQNGLTATLYQRQFRATAGLTAIGVEPAL
jgi:hypothetical protein